MKLPTRLRLAAALREAAAQAQPQNAAKYEAFAQRAETGEFDDFADTHVCPIMQLYGELTSAGFTKFAARVRDGEFDATKEESDAWAASASGQDAYRMLAEKHPTLGDAPIEDQHIAMMQAVASALDEAFNGPAKGNDRKTGFVLLVFPFGDTPGRCNYISNGADRGDIVVMMKEQIKRFEGQPEVKGRA